MKRALAASLFVTSTLLPTAALAEDPFGTGDGHWGAAKNPGVHFGVGEYIGGAVNAYASLSADASGNTVTLNAISDLQIRYSGAMRAAAVGDLVMVWQWGGFTGSSTSPIDLSSSHVGAYELARISAISGNTLTLASSLTGTYPANASQVVLVPEYASLITTTSELLAKPFDPATGTGGIIAFLVRGDMQIGSIVSASGAGFPPGAVGISPNMGCTASSLTLGDGGGVGGGIYWTAASKTTPAGFGSVGNGGGGGDCTTASGGGGGNGTLGGSGGAPSSGGPGGAGGAALKYSLLDHLVMGGGGGGAQGPTGAAVPYAGAGGGVIFVKATLIIAPSAMANPWSADGSGAGGNASTSPLAVGGGGGGGTILIRAASEIDSNLCPYITAKGGPGGNSPSFPTGWGGDGGAGRILVQGANTCTPPNPSAPTPLSGEPTVAQGGTGGALDPMPTTSICPSGSRSFYCAALICNDSLGVCAACNSGADCKDPNKPACTSKGTCGACSGDADCVTFSAVGSPHCATSPADPKLGTCVACRTSADCAVASPICGSDDTCGACTKSADCAARDASKPVCDDVAASATKGQCIGCRTSADCSSANAPTCDAAGVCGACAADADCARFTGKLHCAAGGGACVECVRDADCPPERATCNNNACVGAPTPDGGLPESGTTPPPIATVVTHCRLASDCPSGVCTGGICCDRACDGLCESCTLAASPGKCTKAPLGTDPKGQCGTPGECLKTCGGDGSCVPAFAGAQCAAPRCTGEHAGVGQALCQGSGIPCALAGATTFDCGAYICDPAFGACRSNCTSSSDCSSGYACDAATKSCVAGGGTGGASCSVPSGLGAGSGLFGFAVAALGLGARVRRRR